MFDEYGNVVPHPGPDELPLDYQAEGHLYIRIKDFTINQNNLDSCTCYTFQINMYGSNKVVSAQFLSAPFQIYLYGGWEETTNNFAYTDIYDCLRDAVTLVRLYKDEVLAWFSTVQETYQSAMNILNERGEIIENFNDN